ncbi:MAG: sigma-70 family RNA polymerase sigma factor [Gemmataceae bacterium]
MPHATRIEALIEKSRQGISEALGKLLEECRPYLLLIAREELQPQLQAKLGASDLVQHTFLLAINHFDQFNGSSREELQGWLRAILRSVLMGTARSFTGTAKRDSGRETQLEQAEKGTSWLVDPGPNPSSVLDRAEQESKALRAIELLPEHYRQVLLLHHRDGLCFEEIGRRMNRSPDAIRMLWTRAVVQLGKTVDDAP